MKLNEKLEQAKNIPEIFELVKKIVKRSTKLEQAGLTLSLSNLGTNPQMLLGAFYSPDANMIVVNNSILKNIQNKNVGVIISGGNVDLDEFFQRYYDRV